MAATRNLMRAVRVFEFGGPEVLKIQSDVVIPVPKENQKGDRIFTIGTISGGYADYAVAAANKVFPLSDKLDFKQGAAVAIPYFTAYRALFQKGHAKAGESVLVHGASGGGERSELTLMNSVEYVTGISPYQLPVINHMIPVPPPALQKGDKSVNAVRAVRTRMLRGRLFHPTTAANDRGQLLPKNSGGFPKPLLHSNAFVTMIFLGKGLHLRYDSTDYRDEIEVCQQHCGG